jgi:hypothetical protein
VDVVLNRLVEVGECLRVTGIAPDEERIAAASGVLNKEDFVQKEMCRWCGIVMARTAMSMISL